MPSSVSQEQFSDIWAEAFVNYKKRTGRDLKTDGEIKGLQSVDDLLRKLDQSEKGFQDFRGQNPKLWKAISVISKPVILIGGAIQNSLSLTPFAPTAIALGAILFLVKSANGVSDAYDTILDLFSRISSAMQRIQEYSKSTMHAALQKIAVEILCKFLELIARAEKLVKRRRIKEYFYVTFLGKDDKVAKLLKDLERLTDQESKLVLALVNSTTRAIETGVDALAVTAQHTLKGVDHISNAINDARQVTVDKEGEMKLESVLQADIADKLYTTYRAIASERIANTGDWILDDVLFRDWVKHRKTILWILGEGGVGKSFLTSRIIQELELRHPQEKDISPAVSVAYFFVKGDNESFCSTNNMLKSIAFQITRNDQSFRRFATDVCKNTSKTRTAEDTWQHLYLDFFTTERSENSVFIVLDALDEAPPGERGLLFKLLKELERASVKDRFHSRLQIALIGRREISEQWGDRSAYIEVSATKMSADVSLYIEEHVKKVKVLRSRDIDKRKRLALKRLIVEKLQAGALGMFLWVKLVLQEITNQSRPSDIESILNAPRDLFRMIRQIFERIAADHDSRNDDLNEILIWVAFSRREMLLGELKFLLRLRPPIGEGLPDLEDRLRNDYASFFILTRADGKTTEEMRRLATELLAPEEELDDLDNLDDIDDLSDLSDEEGTLATEEQSGIDDTVSKDPLHSDPATTEVRFSHNVIRDFLLYEHTLAEIGIGVDTNAAHAHIVTTCLLIITDKLPKLHGMPWPKPNLTTYAANAVLHHLRQIDVSQVPLKDQTRIVTLLYLLITDSESITRWLSGLSSLSDFFNALLGDRTMTQVLQTWLMQEKAQTSLDEADKHWIKAAGVSIAVLLKPMANASASQWLTVKSGIERVKFSIAFLHTYDSLDSHRQSVDLRSSHGTLSMYETGKLSSARIRQLARTVNLVENSFWHTSVGFGLRISGHFKQAIVELETAISLDEGNWFARSELAKAYRSIGNLAKAVEAGIRTLQDIPEDEESGRVDCWNEVYNNRRHIKDNQAAIDAGREFLLMRPTSLEAMSLILDGFEDESRYLEVIEFAMELEQDMDSDSCMSQLTQLLLRYPKHDLLSRAAAATQHDAFVLRAFDNAIDVTIRGERPLLVHIQKCWKAYYLYRWGQDEGAAVELWESVAPLYLQEDDHPTDDFLDPMRSMYEHLTLIYFTRALNAERQGESPDDCIEKLKTFANTVARDQTGRPSAWSWVSYGKTDAEMMLGLYYRLCGRNEEARACLRGEVLYAIEALSDSDPANDRDAYLKLGDALRLAGDIRNAQAAYAPSVAPLTSYRDRREQKPKTVRSPTDNTDLVEVTSPMDPTSILEGKLPTETSPLDNLNPGLLSEERGSTQPLHYIDDNSFGSTCDGDCTRIPEEFEEFYACEYCPDTVNMCDICLPRFKAGKLPYRICNPDHPYMRIFPPDEDVVNLATYKERGRTMPRPEWLEALRKDWST